MKKIIAKLQSRTTEKKETQAIPTHGDCTLRCECEECGKIISVLQKDLTYGAYGCAMAQCPYCHKRTYVFGDKDTDLDLLLTRQNLIFPNHFFKMSDGLQNKNCITQINNLCKSVLSELEGLSAPCFAERCSHIENENVAVIALKNREEINLYVCDNYYHTAIPQTKTIAFPEIKS